MLNTHHKTLQATLEWYLDHGVDEALNASPCNHFALPSPPPQALPTPNQHHTKAPTILLGRAEATQTAIEKAQAANTLESLRNTLENFDGLAIQKTAKHTVFSDGHPQAPIMLITDAPGTDEDRTGHPLAGTAGELLDRMLQWISINRNAKDPKHSIYISNIVNWRPPGNRTPHDTEIEIMLPFIEKHIALIQPRILILCGNISAKALLRKEESLSRLRGQWHQYRPHIISSDQSYVPIPTLTTHHPASLLRTPLEKKSFWADLLMLEEKREALDLLP